MDSISYDTLNSPGTLSTASKSSKSISVQQKEEDYTKDNAISPIDLDCFIQSERINKIFNEAIYKIKLVISLPLLVGESKGLLATELNKEELKYVSFIYELYEDPVLSSSLQDMDVMESLKPADDSMKKRLNPEQAHLICILNSYPSFRPEVEKFVEQMKEGYVSYGTIPAHPALEFLLCMEQFQNLLVRQTLTTAHTLWAEKIKTKKMEISNSVHIKEIQACKQKIEEETEIFNNTMKIKSKILADLEGEMEMHNTNSAFTQQAKVRYSDCLMVLMTKHHEVNKKQLQEDNAHIREKYETILQRNTLVEKHKRAQKFKYEVQLVSWLAKYDTDMADKQAELEEFDEKWKEETKKIELLEEQLAELDKKYLPLMQEREEEYQAEMSEKMNQFMREHAARVLQHAWKTVLANRIEKRKLRKEVAKMQKENDKRQRMIVIAKNRGIAAAKAAAKAVAMAAKVEAKAAKAAARAEKRMNKEDI